MIIKTNPIINVNMEDRIAISKTIRICNELIESLTYMTITDEAYIICADNGEVLVSEKELHSIVSVLNTMGRIFNEAPPASNGSGHKELAVEFIG